MTTEKAIEVLKKLYEEIISDFQQCEETGFKRSRFAVCLLQEEEQQAIECALSIMENSKNKGEKTK